MASPILAGDATIWGRKQRCAQARRPAHHARVHTHLHARSLERCNLLWRTALAARHDGARMAHAAARRRRQTCAARPPHVRTVRAPAARARTHLR